MQEKVILALEITDKACDEVNLNSCLHCNKPLKRSSQSSHHIRISFGTTSNSQVYTEFIYGLANSMLKL